MTDARPPSSGIVLGIDGGNSKVDVAIAAADGRLLAAERGLTVSHQAVGLAEGMARLHAIVRSVAGKAGLPPDEPFADLLVASVAGADYPSDVRALRHAMEGFRAAREVLVVNDTIGALRAGTSRSWGVGLVCGQGINASAIAPNGRMAGFPAVGEIAGDWGGGGGVGLAGLAAAVRGRDGRSPHSSLERAVPAFYGLAAPAAVTRAFYDRRLLESQVSRLSPVVFAEAAAGDPTARAIVDRLATELAVWANALIRRLHMTRLDVEVVLAGGVFRTDDALFYAALERQIRAVAPRATLVHLHWPPVTGAVLLGFDRLAGLDAGAEPAHQLREALGAWDRREGADHPSTKGNGDQVQIVRESKRPRR
jgi:N-acetylglucosamine kinase-like BadF-type ATPase